MKRGTTPTISITTDVDLRDCEVLFFTFCQNNKTIIEKTKEDLTFNESGFACDLSQEETLRMANTSIVKCQIRARLSDGKALASNIMSFSPEGILKDGVI